MYCIWWAGRDEYGWVGGGADNAELLVGEVGVSVGDWCFDKSIVIG
jgi:hypothetical protein